MQVLRVDYTDKNAAKLFNQSLKQTGFAVIYNHPIAQNLIDDIYEEWQNFFASQKKHNYLFKKESQDGFFPQSISETAKGSEVKDIKEFFQYYPWGIYPKDLSNKTRLLYQQLALMAKTLLTWIEHSLPLDIASNLSMPLSTMVENTPQTMLRVLHYPPLLGDEPKGAVRAAAHGDINLLTLLVGSTATGLQVQDTQEVWHDVPCAKDSIAVNIGDMLELCTKHYYHSTLHRVINPDDSNTSRLSMPLFLHPRKEVDLSNGYTAGEFLQQRLIELGVV